MRSFGIAAFTVLALSVTAVQAGPIDPHTIVVAGYAEVNVKPDHAIVDIGIVTSNTVTSEALKANDVKMRRVIDAIKALGIANSKMQTSQFTIEAQHPRMKDGYGEDQNVTLGYQVTNKLTVLVEDIDKVGNVIDAAVKAGANAMNSVSFDTSNRRECFNQALAAAVRNARHYAEIMASAENAKVGKMVSITDLTQFGTSGYNYAPPPPPPPPPPPVLGTMVLPGQIVVHADVMVTYAVE